MTTPAITLREDDLYITSFHNGLSYEVSTSDGRSALSFQGDDASMFRELWDNFQPSRVYPTLKAMLVGLGYEFLPQPVN